MSDETTAAITRASVFLDPEVAARVIENGRLLRYGLDGELLDDVSLPLGDRSLLEAEVVDLPGGAAVAGRTCARPATLGCSPADLAPFLAVVTAGGVREIGVEIPWETVEVQIAGVVGEEAVVVVADGDANTRASGNRAMAVAVGVAGTPRPLELPAGVRFASSVCESGGRLLAVTPVLAEGFELGAIALWASDAAIGSTFELVGTVEREPALVSGASLACSDSTAALLLDDGTNRVLVLDSATAAMREELVLDGERVELLADDEEVVIVPRDRGVERTRLLRLAGEQLATEEEVAVDADGVILLVDRQLLDVSDMAHHVPGTDAPPPVPAE